MDAALTEPLTQREQNRAIAATVRRERGRLLEFIRRRIDDAADAEDVLQEAFYELLAAYRAMQPVERAGAWLVQVARNRLIDRFRGKPRTLHAGQGAEQSGDDGGLENLLPTADADPAAAVMRELLLEEIERALEQLPREQREVFIAHELEGVSFRELAKRTGVSINTLLSRKHYAVRFLRERLQAAWDEYLLT